MAKQQNIIAGQLKKGRCCIIRCLAALILILILPSCTEEAELGALIQEAPGPIVVEGRIAEGENALIVLTRPASLADPENFPQVTDAKVTLLDNRGNEEELLHLGYGHYRSLRIQGQRGVQYSLAIEAGSEKVAGRSFMPLVPVVVDSALHRQVRDEAGFLRSQIALYFQDPSGQADFAWMRLTIQANNRERKYYFFYQDDDGDDQYREWLLPLNLLLSHGQIARIELFQVEEAVFFFFKSILEQVSPGEEVVFLAPPANLSANLEGSSPGYFAATVRTEIVVEP